MKSIDVILLETIFGNTSVFQEEDVDQFEQENATVENYLSVGPGKNEISTQYTYGGGSHKIRFLSHVSPDIVLVHQSKMVGFYLKVGESQDLVPVPRSVKDSIIKDG